MAPQLFKLFFSFSIEIFTGVDDLSAAEWEPLTELDKGLQWTCISWELRVWPYGDVAVFISASSTAGPSERVV